jgi:CTP synthase (UTP-ammonia lyase)
VHTRTLTVGVIGDFQRDFPPHSATDSALDDAAATLGVELEVRWMGTVGLLEATEEELARYDALLCAPGSPYSSLQGALRTIRIARDHDWPLLGTCGGFQHMVIEYARNVLGVADAQHGEYDPYASELFISQLNCSLAGKAMSIQLSPGSRTAGFYGESEVTEQYYCDFGLNPAHQECLEEAGLRVAGRDQEGEARVLELPELRFYVATLFVPQLRSRPGAPHPLLVALLEAATRPAQEKPPGCDEVPVGPSSSRTRS